MQQQCFAVFPFKQARLQHHQGVFSSRAATNAFAQPITSSSFLSPTSTTFTLSLLSLNSLSKASPTFPWNSTRSYFSSPQLERLLRTSGSARRQMTRSGWVRPRSGATHHSQSMPLAQEQATPEYQQRSHTMLTPSASSLSILGMLSQRLAEKSRWMVSLLMSALLPRQELMIWPMGEVRSGKFMSTACSPEAVSCSRMDLVTEDLPDRSSPSSTISLPRVTNFNIDYGMDINSAPWYYERGQSQDRLVVLAVDVDVDRLEGHAGEAWQRLRASCLHRMYELQQLLVGERHWRLLEVGGLHGVISTCPACVFSSPFSRNSSSSKRARQYRHSSSNFRVRSCDCSWSRSMESNLRRAAQFSSSRMGLMRCSWALSSRARARQKVALRVLRQWSQRSTMGLMVSTRCWRAREDCRTSGRREQRMWFSSSRGVLDWRKEMPVKLEEPTSSRN